VNSHVHFASGKQFPPTNHHPMNQASDNTSGASSRWLLLILLLSVLLRLGMAFYLGNDTRNWLGGTADQLPYDNFALRPSIDSKISFG
jgi:hypothetical protein